MGSKFLSQPYNLRRRGGGTIDFGRAGGRRLPRPTHSTHPQLHGPSLIPAHTPVAAIPTSGLGGRDSPKSALESKAAGAVSSDNFVIYLDEVLDERVARCHIERRRLTLTLSRR